MRNLSILALLTLLLHQSAPQVALRGAAPQQQGGVGVIQGTIIKAGTSEGISGVQITVSPRSNRAEPPQKQFTTTSDSNGQFELKDLPADSYTIRAQRDGYFGLNDPIKTMVNWTSGAATLAGGRTVNVTFSMFQGGTINGRIRNRDGQGVSKATVTALRFVYQEGRALLESVVSKQSDDRGDYRIFWLPPGEYFVAVIPSQESDRQGGAATSVPQGKTYFPDTIDPRIAQAVRVTDGDVMGINLIPQPSPVGVTVSGRLVNMIPETAGAAYSLASLRLSSLDPSILTDVSQSQLRNEGRARNGEFRISNILPGTYDLIAEVRQVSAQQFLRARTRIEVGSDNLEDVVIPIRTGVDFKGRITVHGFDPALDFDLKIRLRPHDSTPAGASVYSSAKITEIPGELSFANVPDGKYVFQVSLPREDYVEDIRQGTRSIYDTGITITGDTPSDIEVIINTAGETIRGTVIDVDGKPVAGASVVLIPPLTRTQNLNLYKSTESSQKGEFDMDGVAPGDYKLFAWLGVPDGAFENASFMKRYEALGVPVIVAKGVRVDPQVRVIRIDR